MGRLFQEVSSSAESKGRASVPVSQTVCVSEMPEDQIKLTQNNKEKNTGTTEKEEKIIMMSSDATVISVLYKHS